MTTDKNEGLSATPTKGLPLAPSNWRGDEQPGFKPISFRAKVKVLNEHHDMEIRAQRETGTSSQVVIAKTRNSKLYMTTAEKHPQLVAHLSTLNEVPDRAAALHDELAQLLKSITLKPLRALPGRFLMKDDMTSVVYNKKSGQIDVRLRIDLNATPNAEKALIARMQAVNVCLHTNAPFLKRHKN